jgi:hypothetical protein
LPPRRLYDYKIQLIGGTIDNLFFIPLYYQLADKLQAVKQYLVKNLYKGFIKASQAPFTALILFVKKPNRGLQFCIDYYKLNSLTYKD